MSKSQIALEFLFIEHISLSNEMKDLNFRIFVKATQNYEFFFAEEKRNIRIYLVN